MAEKSRPKLRPQAGPQFDAIQADWCPELFFGGARGGGKSYFLLLDYLQDVNRYASAWQGIIFRRSYPELQDLILKSHKMYSATGGEWLEQKKEWRWPNGACLRFRYLEHERDATRYQGFEYTWIGWDELPQWPSLDSYFMLLACLRSPVNVPTKRVRATGNPGGAGHQAVKAYFIDGAPLGYQPLGERSAWRMFIPSKVFDNKILLENDPQYIERLKRVGSEALVRAWLDGDWSVVTGAYFDCWSPQNTIDPFPIPRHWSRFMSFDWGSSEPFSLGWWAVADGSTTIKGHTSPRGSLIKYREWYGASAPNKGLKLFIEQVGDGIKHREEGETIDYRVAGLDLFDRRGGPSLAERLADMGLYFQRADTSRITGWDQMRRFMIGKDNKPELYFFSTCTDSIRTIPSLQHHERDANDVAAGEDHAADECRYAVMSRPDATDAPVTIQEVIAQKYQELNKPLTLDDLYALERSAGRR